MTNGWARLLAKPRGWQKLVLLVALLLLAGAAFTGWSLQRENHLIRQELLQETRLVAQAIPLDRIDALDGELSDQNKPEFQRLQAQLQAVLELKPEWDCIYLLGLKNGLVFFQMDAVSPHCADAAVPGQVYDEASPVLLNVFSNRLPATEGPLMDRWGVWISAFVPLAHPRTGRLLTVAGIDLREQVWRERMMQATVVPLLSTAALLILALAGFRLRAWRWSDAPGVRRRWRRLEIAAGTATGLVLTLAGAWTAREIERHHNRESFAALAHIETERISEAFRSLRNAEIEGVAHFIEGSAVVTRDEFRRYARFLVRVPKVLAWAWVPAVREAERDAFEQAERETGFRSYQIWEINGDARRVRAAGREIYYPLHYVESVVPMAKYGITCGRDLGALPAVRAALEESERARLPLATDLLDPFPGATRRDKSFLVCRPIFAAAPAGPLKGFAAALVDPQRLMDTFLGEQLEGSRQIAMELLQLRPGAPPERLACLPHCPGGPLPGLAVHSPRPSSRPILAFGKTYAVVAHPTLEFVASHSYHVAWIVLLAGLALTAALTTAIVFIAHRREDLERLVDERTCELAASMRRYDMLARQSHVATWEVDAEGLYVSFADMAGSALGYKPDEIAGRLHFYDLHPAEGREQIRAFFRELARRGETFTDLTHPVQAKSGETLWFTTSGIPVRDADGRLRGYWGTSTDITARKRAEDALALLARERQQAAERYQTLIRASDTGAWEYHDDTGYMWTSPEYFAMLGRKPSDFPHAPGRRNVEDTWTNLLHPDDRERAWQEFRDYMKRPEGMYQHTFRMSHADGHWVWILSRGQLLRDAEGRRTPVLVGTHIDITDRKRAEQFRELDTRAVQILGQAGEFSQRLDELAALFQEKGELAAVGIRLREGHDFPLAAHRGYTPEHLADCGTVLVLDPQGNPLKDAAGKIQLRCDCGLALAPDAPHRHRHFSPGGSSWTNDIERMIHSGLDPRTEPRDHCVQAGFASVAWIPVRMQGQIIGLLLLHDRRKGRFTPEIIQILESIATHIGDAWQRRRAEQDYHTLFQTMLEGFALHEVILDEHGQPADYRFLALNPAFENMTGLKVDQLLGRTVREALPDAEPRWIEIYGNVALTGVPLFFENYSAARGKYFEVTVFRPAPGQFACIFSDITERKLVEQELRESRRRYVALLANLPGMAYRCKNDRNWTMDFVSQGCLDLTGYAPEDLVRNRTLAYNELIRPEYREQLWEKWQAVLRDHRQFEAEYEITTRDGETRWVWEQGEGIYDEQDRVVWLEGFISDITARKRAEGEREQLIRAIEQSGETIVITDADGRILYVNPAFTHATGYTREEAIGQKPSLLKSGSHDASFYHDMWTTLRAGGVWEGQVVNKRKDGSLFTEQATISPVRDPAGRIVHFVAVKRDISQQLHDQRERENLQNELVQAQKMESIGRLAGGVAHDFNNMLQAILGYTEMALEQVPPDQPLHGDLLEIQKAAQRSSALTRQLQVFARKQTVAPKVLDLNQAVEGMSSMLRRLIGEDIQLDWQPGPDLGFVKIDPSQLDQIVANLCVNARDAIEGTGQIVIETRNARIDRFGQDLHGGIEPGSYVLLSVSDSGCGMAPDVLGHLFEPFFTTKAPGKGTGLGLSTVYGIVKQCGGGIQVYSEPGRGSVFKVYLPRVGEAVDAPELDESQDPAGQHHETILLVEDEETILQASRRMLESLGYQVLATNSPAAALRIVEGTGADNVLFNEYKDHIDLLITDVIMPEMNGPELVARVKVRFPDLKHLFMSGYTANLVAVQGIQTGQTDFIQKPFSRTALAQKVREILDRK